eukprot:TRINITY_DN20107_c0_g1_i1.p1 TRINITY_DN20107_c0_g1~~TRINITY_DN20107_c0_g1_i1.p1  ORF type:complete len:288 (-),score=65.13 TRINITY_DN20107_c0_g1_i1:216-1079(-)
MERTGLASLVSPEQTEEDERENIASDITQLIGWTPLIELKQIMMKDGIDARLIGKIEGYQPLSSVKDRIALRMIEDAEEKGLITPGITTLIEPTSGNLGIALAYVANLKGYKLLALMPANYSVERRIVLKYLGADVQLADPKLGFQGMMDKLEHLKASIPNSHILDQTTNPANPEAHFLGTGGKAGVHNIQGTSPGFIPPNFDTTLIDEVVTVTTEEAMTHARRLAMEEGLLVGISSGAVLAACLKVAKREENKEKMIVTVFSSAGERYLSTELFCEVREECINMTF